MGAAKTIDRIARRFVWKNMNEEVRQYVSTCLLCQMNKPSHQLPLGLLQPILHPRSTLAYRHDGFHRCITEDQTGS